MTLAFCLLSFILLLCTLFIYLFIYTLYSITWPGQPMTRRAVVVSAVVSLLDGGRHSSKRTCCGPDQHFSHLVWKSEKNQGKNLTGDLEIRKRASLMCDLEIRKNQVKSHMWPRNQKKCSANLPGDLEIRKRQILKSEKLR